MAAFDLESVYLALDGAGGVVEMPVGPDFWRTIGASPAANGTMVGVYAMRADWDHWEMHPNGAEVLVLIDGRLDMLLDDGRETTTAPMRAGATLIVPAGVWHRALVRAPGRLLGLTYGRGTAHRPA